MLQYAPSSYHVIFFAPFLGKLCLNSPKSLFKMFLDACWRSLIQTLATSGFLGQQAISFSHTYKHCSPYTCDDLLAVVILPTLSPTSMQCRSEFYPFS